MSSIDFNNSINVNTVQFVRWLHSDRDGWGLISVMLDNDDINERNYDRYYKDVEEMLRITVAEEAPAHFCPEFMGKVNLDQVLDLVTDGWTRISYSPFKSVCIEEVLNPNFFHRSINPSTKYGIYSKSKISGKVVYSTEWHAELLDASKEPDNEVFLDAGHKPALGGTAARGQALSAVPAQGLGFISEEPGKRHEATAAVATPTAAALAELAEIKTQQANHRRKLNSKYIQKGIICG